MAGCYDAIRKRELAHDDHPVFTAPVLNATPLYNESGFTLSKPKSRGKIDAAVALRMAHRASQILVEEKPPGQVLWAFVG